MIKAIFWMAVGALGLYLYQDPSQMNVVVDTAKDFSSCRRTDGSRSTR